MSQLFLYVRIDTDISEWMIYAEFVIGYNIFATL